MSVAKINIAVKTAMVSSNTPLSPAATTCAV